jgi:hypothetical protein
VSKQILSISHGHVLKEETMKADDLDPLHKAALELALQMTLKENDAGRVEQVRGMLRDRSRSWLDVATFASYHQQCRNLHLKPWETPPIHAGDADPPHDDVHKIEGAQKLAQRMRKLGISIFAPDPDRAIAEAEAPAQQSSS